MGVVVEGVCHLVVLTGRLGRLGTGLVWVLGEYPGSGRAFVWLTGVQRESQAPRDLLEEDGLACPVVDVEELGLHISELRGNHTGDAVESSRQLSLRAGDETHFLPRVAGVELRHEWPGLSRLCAELRVGGPGRSAAGGADFFLSLLGC